MSTLSETSSRGARPRRPAKPSSPAPNARMLTAIAFTPTGLASAILAALILVTLVLANSELTGASAAVAASWLAIHQVPVTIDGVTISLLPLMPELALLAMVWTGCARAAREPGFGQAGAENDEPARPWDLLHNLDARRIFAVAISGPFLATTVCLAIIGDAASVLPLEPPNPLVAFAWVLSAHAMAALGGMCWPSRAELVAGLPGWCRVGLRGAGWAGRWGLLASGALVALSLLVSVGQVWQTLRTPDGFVGGVSLVAVSMMYLPNVLCFAAAVLAGAPVQFGGGELSVFGITGGEVPGLPVLAGIPAGPAGAWWPVLLVIPLAIGAGLGRYCAQSAADRHEAVGGIATAAGLGGTAALLVSALSGGELGGFDYFGATAWIFAAALGGWLLVPGLVAVLLTPVQASATTLAPEPVAEPRQSPVLELEVEAEVVEPPLALEREPAPETREADDGDIIEAEVVPLPPAPQPPADPPGPPPLIER